MFGFTFASLCYYGICTYVSPPVDSFVDEAVLPPHVEDIGLGNFSGSGGDVEKDGAMVSEKEV